MLTYLALGDSYTIGEQLPVYENFPSQTVQRMRETGIDIAAPEIVAKTGWTTDELSAGISSLRLRETYDFVSLLIGVNNQYRGRPLEEFREHFAALLDMAIRFAAGNRSKVAVLSIPDWGVTPFAEGRNRQEIATQIDLFNEALKEICDHERIHYIYITPGTREASTDPALLAQDQLHPSGKEYMRWAEKLSVYFLSQLH